MILFSILGTLLAVEAGIAKRTWWCWCLAAKSCILTVSTVVIGNSIVGTVYKSCLPAITEQVVQINGTSSLAKWGTSKRCCTCDEMYIIAICYSLVLSHLCYIESVVGLKSMLSPPDHSGLVCGNINTTLYSMVLQIGTSTLAK